MKFYEYEMAYQAAAKMKGRKVTPQEYYPYALNYQQTHMDELVAKYGSGAYDSGICSLLTEQMHLQQNGPYYLAHPQIVETFTHARMENIPFNLLQMPSTTMLIRLAQENNTFVVSKTGRVVRSILAMGSTPEKLGITGFGKPFSYIYYLSIDTGEEGLKLEHRVPIGDMNHTIEDCLPHMQTDEDVKSEYDEDMFVRCLRLVFSVCFLLRTNNQLVEPHILNKDISKYYEGDEKTKLRLTDKACRRRGNPGWKVGFPREHQFLLSPSPPLQSGSSNDAGRVLTNAHLRSGHWHLVRYGKGKEMSKVMWYFPTLVRPDLPFQGFACKN